MGMLLRTSYWAPLAAVAVISLGLSAMAMERRADLAELQMQQVGAAVQILMMRARNQDLEAECRGLLTDAYVERVARDSYGFAAPGERVSAFHWAPSPTRLFAGPLDLRDRWDWWLGRGEFPWRLPAMAFAVSALLLGLMECIEAPRRADGRATPSRLPG